MMLIRNELEWSVNVFNALWVVAIKELNRVQEILRNKLNVFFSKVDILKFIKKWRLELIEFFLNLRTLNIYTGKIIHAIWRKVIPLVSVKSFRCKTDQICTRITELNSLNKIRFSLCTCTWCGCLILSCLTYNINWMQSNFQSCIFVSSMRII